jgi:hypothetical protein
MLPYLTLLIPVLAGADDLETGEGLDLWVLFGSIGLFLAIVVAITLLRRLK